MEKGPARVAIISSYVPRQCGIATFTHNLASAVAEHVHDAPLPTADLLQIVAMNDQEGQYTYDSEVKLQIRQHQRRDYWKAAEILNTSKVDVVSLQHEYGLYGGDAGEYLLDLAEQLRVPLVSTLHTVVTQPTPQQREVLRRICERSTFVVVMAERARTILRDSYEVPVDRVRLIHHGVPDMPFEDPEQFKERFGLTGRPTILTFGLLGPSKSIETMLDALGMVAADHPDVAYIVLGITHPGVQRESGEEYRLSLERRVVELGIQENVLFHNHYVSNEDLCEYLLATDIYVTPYRGKEQITSGTLAYALASGRAIISTPYWHAQELLAEGRGRLADFDDVKGFAKHLSELLQNKEERLAIRRRAYAFGREMIWPRVAQHYGQTFAEARSVFAEAAPALLAERKVAMRMSLPELRLDHLLRMTDDTGLLQHAVYATPDRRHGYCTDDNARGLIVAAMVWSLFQDERVLPPLHVYLAFLHYAQTPDGTRFRNFMSYDRRWLDHGGTDDCQGRVLWSLGYLISHAPNEATAQLAKDLFASAVSRIHALESPRSWALSILGLHYYLREHPEDGAVREAFAELAERLTACFVRTAAEGWPWLEDIVAYDNGRIPQALIIAGLGLDRADLIRRGLDVLEWLLDLQTAPEGHLSVIGSDGWLRRSGERARFDQQPIEPAALIGACKAAYRASEDPKWLAEMRRCFEWYLGGNDLACTVIDFKSRGCHDGLGASGLNRNQGAESVLSWLLSLLIMNEMQTGDAPEAA